MKAKGRAFSKNNKQEDFARALKKLQAHIKDPEYCDLIEQRTYGYYMTRKTTDTRAADNDYFSKPLQ